MAYCPGSRPAERILLSLNKDVRSKRYHYSEEKLLEVKTYLEGVGAALPDREVSVSLLDTPGTNEAGEAELRHQVCLLALPFPPFAGVLQKLDPLRNAALFASQTYREATNMRCLFVISSVCEDPLWMSPSQGLELTFGAIWGSLSTVL